MTVLPDIMEKRQLFASRHRGAGVLGAAVQFLAQWAAPIVLLFVTYLFRHDVLAFLKERMPYVF